VIAHGSYVLFTIVFFDPFLVKEVLKKSLFLDI